VPNTTDVAHHKNKCERGGEEASTNETPAFRTWRDLVGAPGTCINALITLERTAGLGGCKVQETSCGSSGHSRGMGN
jgi:hypothetical protein